MLDNNLAYNQDTNFNDIPDSPLIKRIENKRTAGGVMIKIGKNKRIKVNTSAGNSVKSKRHIERSTILSVVILSLMAFLVLFRGLMIQSGYDKLEAKNAELAAVIAENQRLQFKIDQTLDLENIENIAKIEQRCFSDPWSKNALKAALQNPFTHCFLMEAGGQVCGYACLFVLFEEAELQNIAVDIPFRNQGLGSELVSFLHEFAKEKGAEKSFLEVRVSNRAAIGLYEKHGYAIYGERSRYYQDGESAYVMQKQL